MKYPQQVSMPSAVSNWLEEQLEARGIDGVVYTRYILSLLHTHNLDVICPEDDISFSSLKKNCEIESLVDELCEKLKEVSSEHQCSDKEEQALPSTAKPKKRVTPREQAEKYYAAFPALGRQSASPKKIVSVAPKWIQSPKKKSGRKAVARQNTVGTKLYQQNKLDPAASVMKSKQRHNYYGRGKKDLIYRGDATVAPVADAAAIAPVADQCLDGVAASWRDEEMNMYDDLPVNIRELLESPVPPEIVSYGNVQDKLKDGTKRNFISCNLTSSIWSDKRQADDDASFDNDFNSSRDIDRRLGAIAIDAGPGRGDSIWAEHEPPASLQNEANASFERSAAFGGSSAPWGADVDLEEECFENEHLLNRVAVSLMKINHNKDKSCFAEIVPTNNKFNSERPSFDPFGYKGIIGHFNGAFEKECDLLTSEKSHFRPISDNSSAVKTESIYVDGSTFIISNNLDKVNYVRSDSGSMYLETEQGNSKKYCKYYLEENSDSHSEESNEDFVLKFSICQNDKACQTDDEFSSCAASGPESIDSALYMEEPFEQEVIPTACPISSPEEDDLKLCTCPHQSEHKTAMNTDYSGTGACAVHPFNNNNNNYNINGRPESMMSEILWRYESRGCEACSNNNMLAWNTDWPRSAQTKASDWGGLSMRNIWSGGDVCQACLGQTACDGGQPPSRAAPPPDELRSQLRSQLREDISNDGDQLLSDLSSAQRCYRDDLPAANEIACDVATFLVPKERKRRHSYISDHVPDPHANSRSSWSFASRLEEDCLIQMSTMPSLRSVTL
ncbi:unnamed protein product [Brassicogethes aeneus]|uniref:Uncharacterized protein n=1 Tax=Brassicogethes aeneus TaxID=1431903 RepID=A0A9P0FLN3_BRAAE|nr:unnamed protein product [Brassicogethes aeneus]